MKKTQLITIIAITSLSNAASGANRDIKGKLSAETLDINGDGVVSFLEFQESDKNGLSGLDIDKDGFLTLEEVLKSKPGAGRSGKSLDQEDTMISELFKKMDTNFDSFVTLDEFQDAKFDKMDSDKDGVLSEEELRPKHNNPRKMKPKNPDTNGDGLLSLAEVQENHKSGLSEQDIAKFNSLDLNNDGFLSKEELDNSGAGSKPKQKRPGKVKPKNPDTNGDGLLSLAEVQENKKNGLSEQGIAKFESLDLNSDGFLSKEELDKGHTQPKGSLRPNHNSHQYIDQRRQRSKGRSNIQREGRPNAYLKEQ